MPLDINAFRSIAGQSPDKFIYAQGETLKASRSETRHGAHTYRAATNAFLKACVDHYGSRMGEAIVKFLQADIEGGKPLTARKIKALVEFADETMGSAKTIDVGGTAVELEKVGTDSMSRVGFRTSTKLVKAQAGQRQSAAATLAAFKFGADGKVDLDAVLRHLNTFRAYIDREIAASGAPAEPTATKLFEKGLFTAIDAMDNNELSAVYQGLISKQTDGFKKELARIINHPGAAPKTVALAEKAFADLSRVEAMVVSEISRRMILDKTPDEEKANVPSLMERYVGEGANPANHYDGARDMSTVNLAIMAGKAAKGSNDAKTASAKTDEMLKTHGMGAVDSKKIGDMLRSQELTINMKFAALMGYRRSGAKTPSLFQRPNAHLVNTFESKEEQNMDLLGTGQLRHRNEVEKCFFPEYGTKPLQGRDRPVYGALNIGKFTSGGADTNVGIYGKVVVVLRPHVKQNCTYTLDDSFWATRISLPQAKRAEMEEKLVAAFAHKLKDPDAALAQLRNPESRICQEVTRFYTMEGSDAENLGAHWLDDLIHQLQAFLSKNRKDGEPKFEDGDIYAHFVEHHALKDVTQSKVAGYDNIENLLAQHSDFTALSMGVATLRSQENPKTPSAFAGCAYIEAQFHGPVVLDRDVEEIRIDTSEMHEHFRNLFYDLPQEEQDALDEDAWIKQKCDDAIAEIKNDTKNAPFKVTFYDSEATFDREERLVTEARESQEREAIAHLKDDFAVMAQSFLGERFGEVKDFAIRKLATSNHYRITGIVGENLEHVPDWIREVAEERMAAMAATLGTNTGIYDEAQVRNHLASEYYDLLVDLDASMECMDTLGYTDPAARDALLKEIVRAKVSGNNNIDRFVAVYIAAEKALADVNAFAKDVLEKDVENGSELMRLAFNGLPPLSGVAARSVSQIIQNEVREINRKIVEQKLDILENEPAQLVNRLRKAVRPFIERKAKILSSQAFMEFPTVEERNAFLAWATSAGKLKNDAEFSGIYEGSTKLADAFEAKIKSGAPLTAQDLVDTFKSFVGTAFDYMQEDAKQRGEYGPDDRSSFIGRITSVALSRLAVRVGREGLAKIAAALDTADARWLHTAILTAGDGKTESPYDTSRAGTLETAGAFFEILHQRLTEKFDLPTHPTNPPAGIDYRIVPPAARALVAQINPVEARDRDEMYPYDPASSGARRLANVPAPVNPAALPQDKAGRKAFLVDRMLPIYHAHEKGFDYGYNYHGRTHATRSFVFSIAMGNILKEKGVALDMNAVALATAGHDTGRQKNGRDTEASEKRSADTVVAAVNEAYPGAAGPGWTAQVEANITTKTAEQETIEGYLFKCADSLDYTRVGELDEGHFPFLQEPIATPDGFVLPTDTGIRRQLMKEAKLLSELTSPHVLIKAERDQLADELVDLPAGQEFDVKNARLQEIDQQILQSEKQQTDTLSNQQIVDLVEDAIRSRPQDFPLLTRYYLGVHQNGGRQGTRAEG